jgi:fructokinase
VDTDVNAAALGEKRWGAAKGVETFVYLTVGTGIGGGGMVEGRLIHGLMHPEMGHMMVPHDRQADPFQGVCRFHGDCLEGLACGPAIEARWGKKAQHLPPGHAAWPLEARYLALGVTNLINVLSPQRIILGGGVMQQAWVLPLVQQETVRLLSGYFPLPLLLEHMERYLVAPELGNNAGVLGALALGLDLIPAPSAPRPRAPRAR